MKKFVKPSIFLSIIVGILIGGGGVYLVKPYNSSSITPEEILKKIEDKNSAPQAVGTLSPHTVATQAFNYVGKDITVFGTIHESLKGDYIIVSPKTNEQLSLKLDFSKSQINPKEYSNQTFDPNNPSSTPPIEDKAPVKVIGKIKEIKNDEQITFVLVVEKIEK